MMIPRENAYQCLKCRAITTTIDVDIGSTPMLIPCNEYGVEGCDSVMKSNFYPRLNRPDDLPDPQWEWYKPEDEEVNLLKGADPATWQYVVQGGLLLRPRTNSKPVYHEEGEKRAH